MGLIIEIARFDFIPIGICIGPESSVTPTVICFIGLVIPAVSILSNPGLIAMKDQAGPVYIDAGML
jgi:hypothetical protein